MRTPAPLLLALLASLSFAACGLGFGFDPGAVDGGDASTDGGPVTGGGTGTGGDSGGCAAGTQLCAGTCTDTSGDPANCGTCGHACSAGQVCQGSSCQAGGDCRQTPCTGLSYCDLGSGQCKPGCLASSQCKANETCDVATHACLCSASFHRCAGTCVSNGLVASCGSTSCTPCTPPAHGLAGCNGQACTFTCQAGYHACGNACLANTSPASCGASCQACPAVPNGTATCDGTTCGFTCGAGSRDCGGGTCAPCPAGAASAQCFGAVCVATGTCSDGLQNQGETDVDCGGPCPGCAGGKVCSVAADCAVPECDRYVDCTAGHCAASGPRPNGTACVGAGTTPSQTWMASLTRGCVAGECLWLTFECVFSAGAPMFHVYKWGTYGQSSVGYTNTCSCSGTDTNIHYTMDNPPYGVTNFYNACAGCSDGVPSSSNKYCWTR